MEFALNFIGFIGALLMVILSLGIVWQLDKGLDEAFKLFTVAAFFVVLKQLFWLLDNLGATYFQPYQQYLAVLTLLFLILFLFHFNNVLLRNRKKR